MKKVLLALLLLISIKCFPATKYWDGGGSDGLWATAANWNLNILPAAGDDVVLDNSLLAGTYTVTLPVTAVTVLTLTITATGASIITLTLPSTNTSIPGFQTTGSIYINSGGVLKNSSTAASVPTITIGSTSADSMYIYNGGTYEHNTARSISSNAPNSILDKTSTGPGTEYGRTHFNVPLSGVNSLSLQNRTFGTVEFSAGNAPSALTYTSSGTGGFPLTVRGDFIINSPAAFSSTITGNITVAGNFTNNGNFSYAPSTSGAVTRSLLFNGTGNNQVIQGTGTFTLGANVKNVEISSNAYATLQRNISLPGAGNTFVLNSSATLQMGTSVISGSGTFTQSSSSYLGIGSPDGITAATSLGNVQTNTRNYNAAANFEYNGSVAQATGNGLPASVKNLVINNSATETISLTNPLNIDDTLSLQKGFLSTSSAVLTNLRDSTAISSPASNYTNLSNLGWEKSFIRGPVRTEIRSNTQRWLPVGKITATDTLFAPAAVKTTYLNPVNDTIEYFAAKYTDTAVNAGQIHHISALEYWTINSDVVTTDANAKITLSWRPNSKVGNNIPLNDAVALDNLVISHYLDGDGAGLSPYLWYVEGGDLGIMAKNTGADVNYGTLTSNLDNSPVTILYGSKYFTLGTRNDFNLLPLKLLDFSATARLHGVDLQWITAEEKDIKWYDIEKSVDGIHFSDAGSVISGNYVSRHVYSASDLQPADGWNYYRLKVLDKQQKAFFTQVVKVWTGKSAKISLYPNPAQKELKIILPSRSTTSISIVNSGGQVVKQVRTDQLSLTINIETLSPGIYFIYFRNSRQAIVQRFNKQ